MEKNQKIFLILLTVIIVSVAFFLASPYYNPVKTESLRSLTGNASGSVTAFYFYGDGCSHCEKVKPLIADLEVKYPDLNLTRLEVYNNAENRQQFLELSRKFGVANPGVPIIFIGNSSLIGEIEITERFESEIIAERERIASCNSTSQPVTPEKEPKCPQDSSQLSLPLVILAAMVDSANPCGLSVLVFLLIPMAVAGSRRRILLVGGVYITAMFLFHLFVGIGLFSVFSLSGLSRIFALIGGAIALILGIITIVDVIRNKETFILSIPESKKGLLGDYIRIASLPAAFILGILAGILGFSCTGGIYISILAIMGTEMTVMAGLPWLALYNIVYILPLILITLLIAYGISPEKANSMRSEYKRTIRLIIGLVLVTLGVVILFGWVG
jgi:cytochrome c biogenesis protein CcdA/glutaredoxin